MNKSFYSPFLFILLLFSNCHPLSPAEGRNTTNKTPLVKTGIEVLQERGFDVLQGKKVGLVTNATGVDSRLRSTVDILHEAKEVNLVALYGPEHGVRGNYSAGEYVEFYQDSITQLPVYSLYGKSRKPNPEMLEKVDVLVYDIQDIGCRSYTYISTMGLVMEAAAENGKEVVVLDRPNPLGGERIEGNLAEEGFISFVSQFKIPYVYGLTCGELARMLNREGMLAEGESCELTVIPMEGWERSMYFEETGLEWVPTSPHIPHKHSPFFYPVSGILGELYAYSIGVGYTYPFQSFAAPWIEPNEFAKRLNALNLPGVIFRPISYKPYYSVGKGEYYQGVQVHLIDFRKARLSEIQFYVMQVSHELYPEKDPFAMSEENRLRMFDLVTGSDQIRKRFSKQFRFEDIQDYWYKDVASFRELSKLYYLY